MKNRIADLLEQVEEPEIPKGDLFTFEQKMERARKAARLVIRSIIVFFALAVIGAFSVMFGFASLIWRAFS